MEWNQFLLCDAADLMKEVEDKSVDLVFSSLPDISQTHFEKDTVSYKEFQANIIKYGSRYGSKEGKEKKDLLKVIHYAMLLLHFDEHYGKPSMTSGNIDHTMP